MSNVIEELAISGAVDYLLKLHQPSDPACSKVSVLVELHLKRRQLRKRQPRIVRWSAEAAAFGVSSRRS